MTKIYMVRHGQASAGWGEDADPGLSTLGLEQALEAAHFLAPLSPLQIITSPLARARQTAQALCDLWHRQALIEPRVAEIPSPSIGIEKRGRWLKKIMQDRWPNLDSGLQAWRSEMIHAVGQMSEDTVIFSHFIAINVLYGTAVGDDRVVGFLPDNASITILEVQDKQVRLIEKGKEARTMIR